MARDDERARKDEHATAPPAGASPAQPEAGLLLSEEQLRVGTEVEESGRVRAVKHVDTESVSERVQRGVEQAEVERADAREGDSGEVETLPDGSLSIPVFEERIFVEKRRVVRERVIVRKHTVYEEQEVTAQVRRERLEFQTEGDVRVVDDGGLADKPV